MDDTLLTAIWARIAIGTNEECWNWQGCITTKGYGEVRKNGRLLKIHRLIYEQAYGAIPKGRCVVHKCGNKKCANPSHMYLFVLGPVVNRRSSANFWAKVDVQTQEECWHWKAGSSRFGY